MATRVHKRYRVNSSPNETWCVVDIFLGMPVMLNELPLIDMELQDAKAAADMLNAIEISRLSQNAD
jgi:hypothetical protein